LPGAAWTFAESTVAADPDLVGALRQIGTEIAAAIIGDDDLGQAGRRVGGLGDHPDAGLWTVRARNHAAEIGAADGHRDIAATLRLGRHGGRHRDGGEHHAGEQRCALAEHLILHCGPPIPMDACSVALRGRSRELGNVHTGGQRQGMR
jgi:hypothetical protein